MDHDGLVVEAVEDALKKHTPSMIYTVPSYHNPSGATLTEARRRQLTALSGKHGFTIVADEVYQLLYFYEKPPPAFGTMVEDGSIVSLGSFSKILAPGLRLGWLQTSDELMKRFQANGVLNSGGSVNHFASHIARHAINSGLQLDHLERIRPIYRNRLEAIDSALREQFGNRSTWITPKGGYFVWLGLPEQYDADQLLTQASAYGVGFHTGAQCSSQGNFKNYLRLSFSAYKEDEIQEGVARLAKLVYDN
jgi:DNA-binding transcriptional MocR family regulator